MVVVVIMIIFPLVAPGVISHNNLNNTGWSTDPTTHTVVTIIPIVVILVVLSVIMYAVFSAFKSDDYKEPVRKPNPYLTDMRAIYPNDNRVKELKKILSKLKNVPDDMKDELLK